MQNHHNNAERLLQELERIKTQLTTTIVEFTTSPFKVHISDCVFNHLGQGSTELHNSYTNEIALWIERRGIDDNIWSMLWYLGFTDAKAEALVEEIRSKIGVCAYCKNLYFMPSGDKIHQLSSNGYCIIESENAAPDFSCGCCSTCHKEILEVARA